MKCYNNQANNECDQLSEHYLDIYDSLSEILLIGPKIAKASGETLRYLLGKKHQNCCDIPETACPPKCVGTICWKGAPGDEVHYQLQITNTGCEKRDFTLKALPFATGDELTLSKKNATLDVHESFQSKVSFKIPENYSGSQLETEILITGAYEQCIKVYLDVTPIQCLTMHIKQGEIPTKIKAKNWFNHFQCEVPCFDSADKTKTESV